jgi:hypothetical protein
MTILTRMERERLVLDLYYNQGKTYREIAKELRISPRDIGIILNKAVQEKGEASKEQGQDNIMMLRKTNNKNNSNNTYLQQPKPTNYFLIERLH